MQTQVSDSIFLSLSLPPSSLPLSFTHTHSKAGTQILHTSTEEIVRVEKNERKRQRERERETKRERGVVVETLAVQKKMLFSVCVVSE